MSDREPRTKGELLARIDSDWTALRRDVDAVEHGLREVEAADGWSVKDHVSHIGAWEEGLRALLEKGDRQAAMGVAGLPAQSGFDEINAAIRLLHHNKSWNVVEDEALVIHAGLLNVLSRMTDEELLHPFSHYEPSSAGLDHGGNPIYAWIKGNTYEHYAEHRPWIASLIESVKATHAQ